MVSVYLLCVRLSRYTELELVTVVAGPLGEDRNILYKSNFVGGNGINILPISVGSENSEDLVCVRLFLRSAVSEPDTDWNCEL